MRQYFWEDGKVIFKNALVFFLLVEWWRRRGGRGRDGGEGGDF